MLIPVFCRVNGIHESRHICPITVTLVVDVGVRVLNSRRLGDCSINLRGDMPQTAGLLCRPQLHLRMTLTGGLSLQ